MIAPEPKKPFHARLMEKLAASRFFTFSALIHVIIVFIGGSVVLFKHYADLPDFAPEGGLVANDAPSEAPPDQPPATTDDTFTPPAPNVDAHTVDPITTIKLSPSTFHPAALSPMVKSLPADLQNAVKSPAPGAKGPAPKLPEGMIARPGGKSHQMMMVKNGGKPESEEAVLRGLRWLVKNQNPDGSWGAANQGAMTGFALLSFLGHGETPVSPEFGPAVQKGLDWLTETGAKFDGHLSMAPVFNQSGVYEHAIATYALGEYYAMTKDERVVALLKKAIGYIVEGQGPDGGWMYGYDKSESDTSVSGWQIQALKAAHLTGLNLAGVDQALDRAMVNLKRVQGPQGGFGYRTASDKYSLTGVGVLCTYFWKQQKDKSVREGVDFIMKETGKDFPVEYKGPKADLYAWYYNTQACLMIGGQPWATWNRLFQTEIVKNQGADGSWPPMNAKGVGELQTKPDGIGPFYRTNLCILMLEVYYRYAPTTK